MFYTIKVQQIKSVNLPADTLAFALAGRHDGNMSTIFQLPYN